MTTDIMTFSEELLNTTRDCIELSNEYLKARKQYASDFNKLIVLITKTGLEKSKKSIENKITELLSHEIYGETAADIYRSMLASEAAHKGLELVVRAYQAHASGIQSIIKMEISGEINENVKAKYGRKECQEMN